MPAPTPFKDSLCLRCTAPPRFITNGRSTFILCPSRPDKYPPQPVKICAWFKARPDDDALNVKKPGH